MQPSGQQVRAGKGKGRKRVREECADCGCDQFIDDSASGDIVCTSCGLVQEGHRVDEKAEWRSFADGDGRGENRERAGGTVNPLLDDGGVATTISNEPGTWHLARAQAQLKDPNRRLKQGFAVVGEMCSRLKLQDTVKDRAMELYKDAHKHLRERKVSESCAACIYIACRVERCPRTFKEITAVAQDTNMVIIMRCFRTITNKLKIQHSSMDTIRASDYLDRFCSNLSVSKPAQQAVKHIGKLASDPERQHLWDGKSPISVAAAVIYLAVQLSPEDRHVTIQHISSHTGASVSAIRPAYATLYEKAEQLVPGWYAARDDLAKSLKEPG